VALTREEVQHIALLARLELTAEEEATFSQQLGKILEYVQMLQEVDTSDVQPTAHVVETENPMRDDEVVNAPQVDRMLANAPERDGDYFKVPKIIE
jgi:aspartyl-tRNA(Asn)/glutamyl-tRNA(Gln) amidotransferase subunit C